MQDVQATIDLLNRQLERVRLRHDSHMTSLKREYAYRMKFIRQARQEMESLSASIDLVSAAGSPAAAADPPPVASAEPVDAEPTFGPDVASNAGDGIPESVESEGIASPVGPAKKSDEKAQTETT